jgi:hypothetical protein
VQEGKAMASRQEAERAIHECAGPELKAGSYTIVDGGEGRWLVARRAGSLAVDREGCVRPVGEVFSTAEYKRMASVMYWLF